MISEFLPIRECLLELRENRRRYAQFDALFSGELPSFYEDPAIRETVREQGRRYRLNLARKAVTTPNDITIIAGVKSVDEAAQSIIEDFWDYNELEFEATEAHKKAYLYGNSAIIALPEDDGNISAYVHSPDSVFVKYLEDKPRKKKMAIHVYTQDDATFVVAYYPDVIQKWKSSDNTAFEDWGSDEFTLVEEVSTPLPGVIPVFHMRTDRSSIGRSRLADIEGAQLGLNDTYVALMSAIRKAGFRQRYLISEKGNGVNDNFSEETDDDEIEQRKYTAGPDTLFHFQGHQIQAGSFDVSQATNFLEPITSIISWMARISDTPTSAFLDNAQPMSGVALRRSERPMNTMVEYCEKLFGHVWKELFDYVLSLHGNSSIAEIVWEALRQDDLDWYDVQEAKKNLNVPNSVLLIESGYTQEECDEWNVDEGNETSTTENPTTEPSTELMSGENIYGE